MFWNVRGYPAEGRRGLERILALPGPPTVARARALVGAAHLAHYQGDDERAAPLVKEAAALYRELDDRAGLPYPLLLQAIIAEDRGDYAAADPLLDEARLLFEGAGNTAFLAMTRYHQGVVAYGRGDLAGAIVACEGSLRLSRSIDDRYGTAAALIQIAAPSRIARSASACTAQSSAVRRLSCSASNRLSQKAWSAPVKRGSASSASARNQSACR